MPLDTPDLLDGLNSVISIPIIPFSGDTVDYDGHARNIQYLMQNNHLSDNRPRVISIAGTSLVHHITNDTHVRLIDVASKTMGDAGILLAALVPNPLGMAAELIEALANLQRPPDAYLFMPLGGTYSPEGLYDQLMTFAKRYGESYGARFLYYFRKQRDRDYVIRLMNDSPHIVGVKIGTGAEDVPYFTQNLNPGKMVIWGIGDRSTQGAELGSRGHTSGINIVAARASDEINNAHRRGDYAAARAIEAQIAPLEAIRFANDRAYNYAAVVEALIAGGFDDIAAGDGGPFNPRVPQQVRAEIEAIIDDLKKFH